jgi:hypothetical protein
MVVEKNNLRKKLGPKTPKIKKSQSAKLIFAKKPKNAKKRNLSSCRRLKFCFHAEKSMPGISEFVSLQNETKMKKIRGLGFFFMALFSILTSCVF